LPPTDCGVGLPGRIAIVGTGHVITATAHGAIFVVDPVVGRGGISGICRPAASDGAVGCCHMVVAPAAHRGVGRRCLVFSSPRDCSVGAANQVAGTPARGSKGGTGLVRAPTRNGGMFTRDRVALSPADGGIGRAGSVGRSTVNYGVGIARAIVFTTSDRGRIATGNVAGSSTNGSKAGGHLINGQISAAATDGGPIDAHPEAVATVAAQDVGAYLVGLEAQGTEAVHTEFQWLIVARAQEVRPGRCAAVARKRPACCTRTHIVLATGPDGAIPLCDLATVAAQAGQGIVVDVIAKAIGHIGETCPRSGRGIDGKGCRREALAWEQGSIRLGFASRTHAYLQPQSFVIKHTTKVKFEGKQAVRDGNGSEEGGADLVALFEVVVE
jgi:hypothetical protein